MSASPVTPFGIRPSFLCVPYQFSLLDSTIIAALKCIDRVCHIGLELDPQWKKVLEAMQELFPALTDRSLYSDIEILPIIADSFMGGSAVPRLQYLSLEHVPILELQKLLLLKPLTLSVSPFTIFPIPGTFHTRRLSLVSRR